MRLALSEQDWLEIRETPWDARAFNAPTRDVVGFAYSAPEKLDELLAQAEAAFAKDEVALVACRVDAEDRTAIQAFQTAGYRFVESSLRVTLPRLHKVELDPRLNRLALRPAGAADAEAISGIAVDSFNYGRFREDIRIPAALNEARQRNWVRDLLAGPQHTLVAGPGGAITSFMCFTIEGERAELTLGGSKAGLGHLSYPFWASVLLNLRERNVRTVTALVSTANVGVMNLYARLGFQFEQVLIGLHLHRRALG